MARLWTAGAELQTNTAGIEFTAIVTTAPAVETTIKRSGNAAWRINNSGALEGFRQQFTTGVQGDYYGRFYLFVVAFPSTDRIIGGFGLNGSYKGCIRVRASGELQLYNAEDNAQIGADSTSLVTGTWYRVEIKHDSTTLASTFVEARVYTDGGSTPFWNPSGTVDITATPTNFRLAMTAADSSLDYIVDDLALNDTSGDFQKSWCGDEKVIAQRPNAAGDNSAWTRGGTDTGANWSQVSEVPPDTTQYVQSNTSGEIDDYELDATPSELGSSDTINVVHVGVYAAVDNATGGDPDIVLRIKSVSGGTVEESASLDVNSVTYQGPAPLPANSNYQLTTYDLPGSSTGTWTKALLDTAQIGYREAVTDTHFARVAAAWTMVGFTPASGGGTTPISGSDTLSLSITDAVSVVVAVSPSDTLSLSLTESSSLVVAVAPSDNLSISLTESASIVVISEPADTLSLSLTETVSITVVIDAADTVTLALTETSALEVSAAYSISDSLSLSLTETSEIIVSVAVSDSLSLSVTENGSPAVSVNPSDTTDLSLTEASSVVVSVNPSDNLDISLTESSSVVISNAISSSDNLTLAITESADIVVSVLVADSLTLSITESSSSSLSVNPNDTAGLTITESASVVVSVNPSDSLTISLTESGSITLSNDVSASDTLSISLTESASVEIAQAVSTSDTLSISLTETAQVAVTVSVVDSVSISITDTATSYGEGTPSDTAGISLTESASVVVSVSVSDNLTISLTEAGVIVATTVAVPISGSDTLTISLTETATIFAVTPPVVTTVRGRVIVYDYHSTDVELQDRTVSMLSIDDSRLYNIVVGDE